MSLTFWLTTLAMFAFASNSLLARFALADQAIDPAGYTGIRLASGAAVLAVLLLGRNGRTRPSGKLLGGWISSLALCSYALTFSLAYLQLGAAVGSLVLFTSVQATMIAKGLLQGERPRPLEIIGFTIAFAAFVYCISPTLVTPDLAGTLLMMVSGIAWGIYSLRGRSAIDPVGETAGNFLRAVPLAIVLITISTVGGEITAAGVALSLASGAIASGIGYVVWYTALPFLTATRASVVQLSVPVITAAGGILVLSETLTIHFILSGSFVMGGIALTLLSKERSS